MPTKPRTEPAVEETPAEGAEPGAATRIIIPVFDEQPEEPPAYWVIGHKFHAQLLEGDIFTMPMFFKRSLVHEMNDGLPPIEQLEFLTKDTAIGAQLADLDFNEARRLAIHLFWAYEQFHEARLGE